MKDRELASKKKVKSDDLEGLKKERMDAAATELE